MTTTEEVTVERRQGSIKAIKQLVEHRTNMLSLYGELAAHRPFAISKDLSELIQRFCEALVDYSADAHFRLYRFIDARNERRVDVANVAKRIYPNISESTQRILDFNDKYDTEEHCNQRLKDLEHDLSHLGELLADRIELEDQLVDVMSNPRR